MAWTDTLNADPLPWLLEAGTPAVHAATPTLLLNHPDDDPEVAASRRQAMVVDIERQGAPSTWVTLRACTLLKAVDEA